MEVDRVGEADLFKLFSLIISWSLRILRCDLGWIFDSGLESNLLGYAMIPLLFRRLWRCDCGGWRSEIGDSGSDNRGYGM